MDDRTPPRGQNANDADLDRILSDELRPLAGRPPLWPLVLALAIVLAAALFSVWLAERLG